MVCISHILVTYQLRDFWVVFTFWLLWITLLWTSVYRFLYGHVLFLLGQGGIADVVTLCWTFGGTARLFSKVAEPFHIPEGYVGSWFSTFLITLAFICLFDYNSPGARSHYILICVSLIADEAEHLSYLLIGFVCLLWRNVSINFALSPALLFWWAVLLLLKCRSSLYVLDSSLLSDIRFAKNCLPFCELSFPFLGGILWSTSF